MENTYFEQLIDTIRSEEKDRKKPVKMVVYIEEKSKEDSNSVSVTGRVVLSDLAFYLDDGISNLHWKVTTEVLKAICMREPQIFISTGQAKNRELATKFTRSVKTLYERFFTSAVCLEYYDEATIEIGYELTYDGVKLKVNLTGKYTNKDMGEIPTKMSFRI